MDEAATNPTGRASLKHAALVEYCCKDCDARDADRGGVQVSRLTALRVMFQ